MEDQEKLFFGNEMIPFDYIGTVASREDPSNVAVIAAHDNEQKQDKEGHGDKGI